MKSDDDVDDDDFARELARYCEDEIANENRRDERRNESESFQLSPIGNAGGAIFPSIMNSAEDVSEVNATLLGGDESCGKATGGMS